MAFYKLNTGVSSWYDVANDLALLQPEAVIDVATDTPQIRKDKGFKIVDATQQEYDDWLALLSQENASSGKRLVKDDEGNPLLSASGKQWIEQTINFESLADVSIPNVDEYTLSIGGTGQENPKIVYFAMQTVNEIRRTDFNGNVISPISTASLGGNPAKLNIDEESGLLFFVVSGQVYSYNVQSESFTNLNPTLPANPLQVAVDTVEKKIYVNLINGSPDIYKFNYDGSGVEVAFTSIANEGEILVYGQKIYRYFTSDLRISDLDGQNLVIENQGSTIMSLGVRNDGVYMQLISGDLVKTNLNGQNQQVLVSGGGGTTSRAIGFTDEKIIFAKGGTDIVQSANFDGSESGDFVDFTTDFILSKISASGAENINNKSFGVLDSNGLLTLSQGGGTDFAGTVQVRYTLK